MYNFFPELITDYIPTRKKIQVNNAHLWGFKKTRFNVTYPYNTEPEQDISFLIHYHIPYGLLTYISYHLLNTSTYLFSIRVPSCGSSAISFSRFLSCNIPIVIKYLFSLTVFRYLWDIYQNNCGRGCSTSGMDVDLLYTTHKYTKEKYKNAENLQKKTYMHVMCNFQLKFSIK